MNRIDMLIKQSTDDCMGVAVLDQKRFARLIVQECAGIFEGLYTDQQRPERIDTRIKQHFGLDT